jgi:hypothetical protein
LEQPPLQKQAPDSAENGDKNQSRKGLSNCRDAVVNPLCGFISGVLSIRAKL